MTRLTSVARPMTNPMRPSPVNPLAMIPESRPMTIPFVNPMRIDRPRSRRVACEGTASTAIARMMIAWLCAPLFPPTEATTGM